MRKGKYVILQGDGMGDYPLKELGGRTPLEAASTPNMDALAEEGELGLVRTIPKGMKPGSEVGNLSILGYDPREVYTGRAPLEAKGMGVEVGPKNVAFRCNLVKLRKTEKGLVMDDYSGGHISNDLGNQLIQAINQKLTDSAISGADKFKFYPGTSYRHLMVWEDGKSELDLTPPHDISDQLIHEYMPKGEGAKILIQLIKKSWDILAGQQANSIWLWGCGRPPKLHSLKDKYSLSGFVITAVDLIKGIGRYAGLNPLQVPGATGFVDTNYQGKVKACIKALQRKDFGFLHVEAPDEASHLGDLELKMKAIRDFDRLVVGPVLEGLKQFGDFRLLVMTDHYTPLSTRTHSSEPVPFVIYRSKRPINSQSRTYSEKSALATDLILEDGHRLLHKFLEGD